MTAPSSTEERLIRRLEFGGVHVERATLSAISAYFDLLYRWNRTINLTSLENSDMAIDRLLIEPLSAAQFLPAAPRLIDIGSGGGSPAIPLALATSASHLTMVESRGRKAAFLREAVRALDLPATVESDRAEALAARPQYAHVADVVSVRAVRITDALGSAVSALLAPSGELVVFGRAEDSPPAGFTKISADPLPPTGSSVLYRFRSAVGVPRGTSA